jgi:hypothetical protein
MAAPGEGVKDSDILEFYIGGKLDAIIERHKPFSANGEIKFNPPLDEIAHNPGLTEYCRSHRPVTVVHYVLHEGDKIKRQKIVADINKELEHIFGDALVTSPDGQPFKHGHPIASHAFHFCIAGEPQILMRKIARNDPQAIELLQAAQAAVRAQQAHTPS